MRTLIGQRCQECRTSLSEREVLHGYGFCDWCRLELEARDAEGQEEVDGEPSRP